MRYQGKITNWKDEKGFGFITPNGGGEQVFVHIKSFSSPERRPVGNETVTYRVKMDAKGRFQAEGVSFLGERATSATSFGRSKGSLIFAMAFLGFIVASVLSGNLPIPVLGLYLIASIVAFFAYALDKSAARNEQWRTQESTLHLFALIGGWPGALAAQMILRHKSKKQSFQLVFWVTVFINCSSLAWFFSSSGSEVLSTFLVHFKI